MEYSMIIDWKTHYCKHVNFPKILNIFSEILIKVPADVCVCVCVCVQVNFKKWFKSVEIQRGKNNQYTLEEEQ